MKVICLTQAYNEGMFMHQYLQCIYPLIDEWIITEGNISPFGNQSKRSNDNTRGEIKTFIELYDKKNKIKFYDAFEANLPPRNREDYEGLNKNFMLKKTSIEHGDLVVIGDCDEFWKEERFLQIVERFRNGDKLEHVPVEEYQFAYNLRTYFNAEHNGRFMRYVNGAKFGSTNHFIYPDGRDITKDYSSLAKREDTGMCHLCWCKHPLQIREKVISFGRPSFTKWYNAVYLGYPFHGDDVYRINNMISPYFGKGFAEGQHEKLQEFKGKLPWPLQNMHWDHTDYIKRHYDELIIR